MKNSDVTLLLDTLADHEKALSRLYEKFAQRFPRTRDLWTQLSKDEENHSRWILKLKGLYEEGKLDVNPSKITMMSVKTSIKFIEGQIDKVDSGEITETNALSIASDLERAMIDERYFRIFSFADLRFAGLHEKLEKATVAHKTKLKNAMELAPATPPRLA